MEEEKIEAGRGCSRSSKSHTIFLFFLHSHALSCLLLLYLPHQFFLAFLSSLNIWWQETTRYRRSEDIAAHALTLTTSSLSFVLEVSIPPFWDFLMVFTSICNPSSLFPGWEWSVFGFSFFFHEALGHRGGWLEIPKWEMGIFRGRWRLSLCR